MLFFEKIFVHQPLLDAKLWSDLESISDFLANLEGKKHVFLWRKKT